MTIFHHVLQDLDDIYYKKAIKECNEDVTSVLHLTLKQQWMCS